jgi:Glycosyl transferases group 1
VKERLRTLYLEANGVGTQVVIADTVLRGLLGYRDGAIPPRRLQRYRWISTLFAELRDVYAQLSYAADWRDAFAASPDLAVERCNINDLVHFGKCLLGIRQYDLIVIAHTAAGDDMSVLSRAAGWFNRRRAPMVVFIGNEYDILDDKIVFIRTVEAEFVCSQLPLPAAKYLYRECDKSQILEMPHALNPAQYFPDPETQRDVDVGFIGDIYWPFVGDRERTDLIEWFEHHGVDYGLHCDIRRRRVGREQWCRFLNGCKAVIGAESGTYYLNERGKLLERARAYNLFEQPEASFEEVFDKFYRGQKREVSGKSISSRHFEPVGAKTCQILLRGHYNGIFEPDRHYIAVDNDLGNIGEALLRFRDPGYREQMATETYEYVMAEHTYAHRVAQLVKVVTSSARA